MRIETAAGADPDAIAALLADSMGRTDDPRFAALLDWKHRANPFGPSAAWVAVEGDQIVGHRAFMRWELTDGGRTYRAGRAVDAATHPDHQRKGIFRALTLHGLDALRAEGVDFVFNTPNQQSLAGNLQLGWEVVGTLRPGIRPRSPAALPTIARGRSPAGHWGLPCEAGLAPADAFADDDEVAALLAASEPAGDRLRTRRSAPYLRWRYDGDLLGYRVLPMGTDLASGAACFRLRQRGPAVEATIGDLLVPGGRAADRRRLIGAVLRATGAHYALVLGGRPADGITPLPGQGPTLVWRELCETTRPPLDRWSLGMGDIELF